MVNVYQYRENGQFPVRRAAKGIAILLLCMLAPIAQAHKASDSYLRVDATSDVVRLRLDVALKDLEVAIGIDSNDDELITWGELRRRYDAIARYAFTRLTVRQGGHDCAFNLMAKNRVVEHSDGAYASIERELKCNGDGPLSVSYRLLFDLDPSHRGLLSVRTNDGESAHVLSPQSTLVHVDAHSTNAGWNQFKSYWRDGVHHILIGFDHLLFLATLLLPVVLYRREGSWHGVVAVRPAMVALAGIITAFTLAHSITLSFAVLSALELPVRVVESAIALTVVVAALNNLRPFIKAPRWVVAFVLGLIHGFGFATVLNELGLKGTTLVLALAGFNLGVECGQLALAIAVLPVAFRIRDTSFYRRGIVPVGSILVAVLATIWLMERSLGFTSRV